MRILTPRENAVQVNRFRLDPTPDDASVLKILGDRVSAL